MQPSYPHKHKGQAQAPVDNHLKTNQFRHKNKKHLRLAGTTGFSASFASQRLLTRFEHPDPWRQSTQSSLQHNIRLDVNLHDAPPSVTSQQKRTTPVVVKTIPLAAAKRLAKLCLETQPIYKHKALLFPSTDTAYSRPSTTRGPLLSKHLKGRRSRADSYSSSSSESSGLGEPFELQSNMTRYCSSMHDSVQAGVSRLTEDLASSLHLEKPISNTKFEYTTSPSAASTYSDHSLFSERSYFSNHTNHSSYPLSDSGHCVNRTSVAHPSAQRILSLHHHSPDTTPKKSYVQPKSATHRRVSPFPLTACSFLDDSRSRYFSRRNAIAPMADIEHTKRTGASSFGPMRTSRSIRAARTPLSLSHVRCRFYMNRRSIADR